jgi:hypothetical protein
MLTQNDQVSKKQGSGLSVLLRIYWMFLGNVILFICALLIVQKKAGIFHPADVVFWITVAALIIARYLDIKFCDGYTVTDKPATMSHWTRYFILLSIISGVMWTLMHLIKYLFVNR